jgi:hypothetical protein
MKIYYIDEYGEILFVTEQNIVPSAGHRVSFDDIFTVRDVLWHPADGYVNVYVSESAGLKPKVANKETNAVKLSQVTQATELAEKAMKQARKVTDQVSSITRHNKTQAFKDRNESR